MEVKELTKDQKTIQKAFFWLSNCQIQGKFMAFEFELMGCLVRCSNYLDVIGFTFASFKIEELDIVIYSRNKKPIYLELPSNTGSITFDTWGICKERDLYKSNPVSMKGIIDSIYLYIRHIDYQKSSMCRLISTLNSKGGDLAKLATVLEWGMELEESEEIGCFSLTNNDVSLFYRMEDLDNIGIYKKTYFQLSDIADISKLFIQFCGMECPSTLVFPANSKRVLIDQPKVYTMHLALVNGEPVTQDIIMYDSKPLKILELVQQL